MSNFQFLQEEWSSLYSKVKIAEERVFTEPISSAGYCRMVLEESIHRLYDIEHLDKPFNTELVNLVQDEQVKNIIPLDKDAGELGFIKVNDLIKKQTETGWDDLILTKIKNL
jgi:type I restriction enzyme R subunit